MALQSTLEEKYVKQYNLNPLYAIGTEGVYGMMLSSGMMSVQQMGAAGRMLTTTLRAVPCIVICILLGYEQWPADSVWTWVMAVGFIVALYGALAFNEVLVIPECWKR